MGDHSTSRRGQLSPNHPTVDRPKLGKKRRVLRLSRCRDCQSACTQTPLCTNGYWAI